MSEKCFITIMAFIGLIIIVANFKPEYKYQLHNYSGVPILLDRENGLMWQYEKGTMTLLKYNGAIVPDGDEARRQDEFESIKKTK